MLRGNTYILLTKKLIVNSRKYVSSSVFWMILEPRTHRLLTAINGVILMIFFTLMFQAIVITSWISLLLVEKIIQV